MEGLKLRIETPNNKNVELGDLLVIDTGIPENISIIPIDEIREDGISAHSNHGVRVSGSCPYHSAIILKKDGTYLIGNRVKGFYTFIEESMSKK
jgi:hypothetical protein